MIVGIDLGTTNSLIAYFSEEGPKIIPNRLGKNLTPSVVSVDEEGNVYVGETARERMSLYPDSVVGAFKRSMGTERQYNLSGHMYRPEELSSFVLRSLKEDAEAYLGEEITEAVISVPAYFDDKRRKATKRAGELAGLKGERMISEPILGQTAHGKFLFLQKQLAHHFRKILAPEIIVSRDACEELLAKIREPVKKSLSDAGLKLGDIDEIP